MSRFWLGLALALAACASPRVGEVGRALCRNGDDDDHDHLTDCEDPDCQNLDQCRVFIAGLDGGMGGRGPWLDGGVIGPPLSLDGGASGAPHKDGGAGGSGGDGEDDSGMDIPIIDGGVEPCVPECAATQACVNAECIDVSAQEPGLYTLHIDSAIVPDASPIFQCYDLSCPETSPLPSVPFGACTCPVDPYVRVTLTHEGGMPMTIGMTTAKIDTDVPTFDDPAIDVKIVSGDVLSFVVYDQDDGGRDNRIFSCLVNLTDVQPGPITCSSDVLYPGVLPQVMGTLSVKK